MKLKDIDLKLVVKDGIIDLKLKAPGVKADVELDVEVYQTWAKPPQETPPQDAAAAAKPVEPPVANGLGTSPSLTLQEWAVIFGYLAQAIHRIAEQRQQQDEGGAAGEPDPGAGAEDAENIPPDAR